MKKKNILIRICAIVLFCITVGLTILYQMGVFDFTFIDRPGKESHKQEEPDEEHIIDPNDYEKREPVKEPEKEVIRTDVEEGITYDDILKNIPLHTSNATTGYVRSSQPYSKESCIFCRFEADLSQYAFSYSDEKAEIVTRRENFKGSYTTVINTVTRYKPTFSLYAGFIYFDDPTTALLLDANTNPVFNNFDLSTYIPFKATTDKGLPLFKYDSSLYYIDFDSAKPILTEYGFDASSYTRLYADLPSYYYPKNSANALRPYYDAEKELWGYKNGYGDVMIEPMYYMAHEFSSNGLACVSRQDYDPCVNGNVVYINTDNKIVIDLSKPLYYKGVPCVTTLSEPDTYGLESIGMFYFDKGLTRVRYRIANREENYRNEYQADYDMLINRSGKAFNLPLTYNLISYSDGVALLEKQGKYGYYDYTGRWIAQPSYVYATPFLEGVAVIGNDKGKMALITKDGDILLDFVFDYISMPSNGVVAAFEKEHGWTLYYKMTEESKIPIEVIETLPPRAETTSAPEITTAPETTSAPETVVTPETTIAEETTGTPETTSTPEMTTTPETSTVVVPETTSSPEITTYKETTGNPETNATPETTTGKKEE